jgi:hypothetical protein
VHDSRDCMTSFALYFTCIVGVDIRVNGKAQAL